jgi:hypothetical protein
MSYGFHIACGGTICYGSLSFYVSIAIILQITLSLLFKCINTGHIKTCAAATVLLILPVFMKIPIMAYCQ